MHNFKFMFKFSSTIFFLGLTAGGNYQHTGGGTNYQCLPLNPQFDGYSHSGGYYSFMCGTEYQYMITQALYHPEPTIRMYLVRDVTPAIRL